jgi:uncharacterized protein (TIGR03067 family)
MKRILLGLLLLGGLTATTAAADDDESKKDLAKMQGDWAGVSMMRDGQAFPDDDAQALFRTVKDNHYTVYRYRKTIGKGTFTIDATKKPHTIDSTPEPPPGMEAKPVLGIYEWDGENLRTCYAAQGKERPTEFASKAGSGHTLSVWRREKK